jgi:hypothetical protein
MNREGILDPNAKQVKGNRYDEFGGGSCQQIGPQRREIHRCGSGYSVILYYMNARHYNLDTGEIHFHLQNSLKIVYH